MQFEALSNECLGQVWLSMEQNDYAKTHLDEAFRLYREWGSIAKITQMTEDYSGHITLLNTASLEPKMSLKDAGSFAR